MQSDKNKIGNTPLLVLAIPILIEMAMAYTVPIVDVYLLSKVSNDSVAAVSAVMPILLLGMSLIGAFQVAGVGVCSKLIGANDFSGLAKAQTYFALLMFIVGLFLSVGYFFSAEFIVEVLNINVNLAAEATGYYRIWGGSILLFSVYMCFCILLIVRGKMKYIIISGVVLNVVNVVLGYALIGGNWGFSPHFAAGAAIASAIAWFVADVVIIFFAITRCDIKFTLGSGAPGLKQSLKPFFSVALPGVVEPLSYQAAQAVIVAFMLSMDDLSLTARAYLMNFFLITNIWNIAMANAIQTKVANSIGANLPKQAERDVRTALFIGVGGSFLISASIALFGQQVMSIYTQDQIVVEMVVGLMWLSVLVEVGRSLNLVMGGVLKVSGSALFFAYTGVLGTWCVGVGLGYGLSVSMGLGLLGIWLALALDENLRGLAGVLRWKSGTWKKNMDASISTGEQITLTTQKADGFV